MTLEQLRQLAVLTRASKLTGWRYPEYNLLRQLLKDEKPVDSRWLGWQTHYNDEKRWGGRVYPDIQVEHTYEGLARWECDLKKEDTTIYIRVDDGDAFHGDFRSQRCEWYYRITDAHTEIIEKLLAPRLLAYVQRVAKEDEDRALRAAYEGRILERYENYLNQAKEKQ
jgi:hypothetical protein